MVISDEEVDSRIAFGECLRRILKRIGISHRLLAQKLNCSPSYVSHFISGRTMPSETVYDLIVKIIGELGTDDELYTLAEHYIDAKSGHRVFANFAERSANTLEMHFLDLFRRLNDRQQMQLLQTMLAYLEENHQPRKTKTGQA